MSSSGNHNHHQSPEGNISQHTPAFAITATRLVQRLADANNPVDGREMSRLGVSRDNRIQQRGTAAFLQEKISLGQFLIDRGAEVIIFPYTRIVTRGYIRFRRRRFVAFAAVSSLPFRRKDTSSRAILS